jgi:hypothetical protein
MSEQLSPVDPFLHGARRDNRKPISRIFREPALPTGGNEKPATPEGDRPVASVMEQPAIKIGTIVCGVSGLTLVPSANTEFPICAIGALPSPYSYH